MTGDLLAGQGLGELVPITGRSLGQLQVGIEKTQLLNGSFRTVRTDHFSVKAPNPDQVRSEIQVASPASLLTVDSICWPPAEMANGTELFVWPRLQQASTASPETCWQRILTRGKAK